jgi:hypothetical protein
MSWRPGNPDTTYQPIDSGPPDLPTASEADQTDNAFNLETASASELEVTNALELDSFHKSVTPNEMTT